MSSKLICVCDMLLLFLICEHVYYLGFHLSPSSFFLLFMCTFPVCGVLTFSFLSKVFIINQNIKQRKGKKTIRDTVFHLCTFTLVRVLTFSFLFLPFFHVNISSLLTFSFLLSFPHQSRYKTEVEKEDYIRHGFSSIHIYLISGFSFLLPSELPSSAKL